MGLSKGKRHCRCSRATNAIEYSVDHYEYPFQSWMRPSGDQPCDFMTVCTTVGGTTDVLSVLCIKCTAEGKEGRYYSSFHNYEEDLKEMLRAHYPALSAACLAHVLDTVVDLMYDAIASYRCSCNPDVDPTAINSLHIDVRPILTQEEARPGVYNISTTEDAERILSSESKLVLAFLDSLVGSETEELAAASKLEDDVTFYQTMEPNVAKLFNIDVEAKRPALVLLKKEAEKISHFDGEFTKSAISDFVFSNKLPLVTVFTRKNAPSIVNSKIKQLVLLASSKDSEKVLPVFQEAAKLFKGKISFVYVQLDNENYGKTARDYFGITGDAPRLLGYVASEDVKKYVYDRELTLKRFKAFEEGFVTVKLKPVYKYLYDGMELTLERFKAFEEGFVTVKLKPVYKYLYDDMELTLERFKAFGEDFLAEKLKPFYKSDPVPETNDGDVKIVVGNNFDEIVLDESKDVLLEIYAPFRGRCQSLEPTAKHVRGIKSLVLAKIDGTTNEHPRLKAEGFPTLLFFPAGNKASDPVTVEADRTVLALYKFLKEHASIPFKLQKQMTPINKSEEGDNATTLKDEL